MGGYDKVSSESTKVFSDGQNMPVIQNNNKRQNKRNVTHTQVQGAAPAPAPRPAKAISKSRVPIANNMSTSNHDSRSNSSNNSSSRVVEEEDVALTLRNLQKKQNLSEAEARAVYKKLMTRDKKDRMVEIGEGGRAFCIRIVLNKY